MEPILNTPDLPYCKGCGHGLIARNTARALEKMETEPLDVIIVTDIGCHGIIDRCLNTHTVHGLHGRSVALGAGIAMGISNPHSRIIVFIGDGGSTIGLQHILEAARLNLDLTVVVHNNMLYGMTGGQTSGLTPCGFNTSTSAEGNPWNGFDICELAFASGAAFVSRITGTGDFSSGLREAIEKKGFSLVEVMEICTGYGVKLNPRKKLSEIMENAGKLPGKWETAREGFNVIGGNKTTDLMAELPVIAPDCEPPQDKPLSLLICGSAGEGVQLAATLLAAAAVGSGYHITQKGSYPVTVGVGFSASELIISPGPIGYHGIETPGAAIVTSVEGLAYSAKRIGRMKEGMLFIDSSLEMPETGAQVFSRDFRSIGARYACLYGIMSFASETGFVSTRSLLTAIEQGGFDKKIPVAEMMELTGSRK